MEEGLGNTAVEENRVRINLRPRILGLWTRWKWQLPQLESKKASLHFPHKSGGSRGRYVYIGGFDKIHISVDVEPGSVDS
jgi:hypothetical protein